MIELGEEDELEMEAIGDLESERVGFGGVRTSKGGKGGPNLFMSILQMERLKDFDIGSIN